MIKKLISIITAVSMLVTCFVPVVMAEDGAGMPEEYGRVLVMADHEDGNLGAGFEYQNVSKSDIESGDTEVEGDDRGQYVNIHSDGDSVDAIYRPKYSSASAPVQATGVTQAELEKMMVSFDICPVVPYKFSIRFYDKWTTGSTRRDDLIVVNTDGTLSFLNTTTKYEYTLKKWMKIDTFLDFASDTYSVYI